MRLARELYDEIVEHAHAEAPNECCGMVASRDDVGVKVYRAVNVAASKFRFEIDGHEAYQLVKAIEASALDLGAIYHSHTRTEPTPSQTDINFGEWWPGVVWIIVGLAGDGPPDVRAFTIRDGQVAESELVVE